MRLRVALAALVAVSLARPVAAQEEVFQVTPYAWGIGIDGSFKPLRNRPEEIRFREGLSDVLDDLDSAFFLSAFYRNGRFVALGDYSRSRSSRDGRIPLLRLPVEARVRQSALTLSAGYRALDGEQAKLDVLAGLRRWDLEARVSTPVLGGRSLGLSADFTDPILAARTNLQLSERLSLIGYVDAGGFGVGSDVTVQALATLNWRMTDAVFLSAGYRHLHVDYEDDGREIDFSFSGPLLGVSLKF